MPHFFRWVADDAHAPFLFTLFVVAKDALPAYLPSVLAKRLLRCGGDWH